MDFGFVGDVTPESVNRPLLEALLTPSAELAKLQDEGRFTELFVRQEEMKTLPFGEVWNEYCRVCGVPEDGAWFEKIAAYEKDVQGARG